MSEKEKPFLETHEDVARYVGMSLDEFLRARSSGRFPVLARPKDPTPVYWRADLDKWLADGKPKGNASSRFYGT